MITLDCVPDVDINSLKGSQSFWTHDAAAVAADIVVAAAAASMNGNGRFLVEVQRVQQQPTSGSLQDQVANSSSGTAVAGHSWWDWQCV
jgi:hypothetical protein